MASRDDRTIQQRFAAVLDLFDFSVATLRQTLARRHPDKSPAELQQLIDRWMMTRPGAEAGDGVGRPVPWPRPRRRR